MRQNEYIIKNPPKREMGYFKGKFLVETMTETSIPGREGKQSVISNVLEIDYKEDGYFHNWKKSEFKIDGSKVFSKTEEMYLTLNSPVNDLNFTLGKEGEVKEISNYNVIKKNWERSKMIATSEFEGKVLNDAVKIIERNIHDLDKLKSLLSRDLFLQMSMGCNLSTGLIYHAQESRKHLYRGIIDYVPFLFTEKRSLQMEGADLLLKTKGEGNPNKNEEYLERFFSRFSGETFNLDDLKVSLEGEATLEYETLWYKKGKYTIKVEAPKHEYEKNIELTITRI